MNKKLRVYKEIGKIAVNLGNLIFASLILVGIINGSYNRLTMLWVCGFIVALLLAVGVIMLTAGGE